MSTAKNIGPAINMAIQYQTRPKTITIIGRRWFERTNGNTYHSATVYADSQLIGRVPFTYGYGNHYSSGTAYTIIQDAIVDGVLTLDAPKQGHHGSREALWRWAERVGVQVVDEVTDVKRKKDL